MTTPQELPGFYQQVLDSMTEGVSVSDEYGNIIYTNPAEDQMFGYARGELLGKPVSIQNAYEPEENTKRVEDVIAILKTKGVWEGEWHNRRKDGSTFYTQSHITAFKQNDTVFWVCLQRDISESRQVNLALKGAEDTISVLLKSIDDHLVSYDLEWRFTFVNPAAERMLGKSRKELIGHSIWEIFPEAVGNQYYCELHESFTTQQTKVSEHFYEPWGKWIENRYYPSAQGVTVLSTDITERVNARNQLTITEANLRLALDAGNMGAWTWDLVTQKIVWWPGMARVHGLPNGSSITCYEDYFAFVHPDDIERVKSYRGAAPDENQSPASIEYRVIWPDGTVRWLETYRQYTRDSASNVIQLSGICLDITTRKQTELDLRFLSRASVALASLVDYSTTLQLIAQLAVPDFADWCAVDILDEAGELKRLAVTHREPAKVQLAYDLQRRYPADRNSTYGAWSIVRTKKTQFVPIISEEILISSGRDEEYLNIIRSLGLRSFIGCPLIVRDKVVGIVTFVTSESGRHYGPDDVTIAEQLALRASVSIENAELYKTIQLSEQASQRQAKALLEETRTLELLNHTGEAIASTLDLEDLLQRVTDSATQIVGAAFGAFFYTATNHDGEVFTLYTLSGAPREAFDKFGHPRATQLFGPTFRGEGPIRIDDVLADSRYGQSAPHYGMPPSHLPVRSYLAVPVISQSQGVLGGLFFGHPDAGMFSARSERIVTGIAAQAALAIENAQMYQAAQRSASERTKLLENERVARAEAERLNQLKDEFLAMLAHELRNPLAPIVSAAEMLKLEMNDKSRGSKAASVIIRQVHHMTELIDDLLDVTRLTRGLVTLDRKDLNLNLLLESAIEQARPLIESRHHQLHMDVAQHDIFINADATRIIQVIVNLLNNAAKYTQQNGSINISVDATDSEARIKITDNGIGIPSDFLPHIFELFTQGERTPDRQQGGLGLGLALVKNIMEMHEGSVTANSAGRHKGSTFTVTFPRVIQPLASLEVSRPRHTGPCDGPLNIFLVDDNLDAATSLAELLKMYGNNVEVFGNGLSLLESPHITSNKIFCFILDIGLPDITGYELVTKLRAHPHVNAGWKFIAVTGYGQAHDIAMSKTAGFHQHLVKPVDIHALFQAIKS